MKNSSKTLFVVIALAALLCAAVPAGAQTYSLNAKVPFSFLAGNRIMPPGEYSVKLDPLDRVMIDCPTFTCTTVLPVGSHSVVAARAKSDQATLEFQKYGDMYVLSRVARPHSSVVSELAPSKKAVQLARAHSAGEVAAVTLR